MTFFVHTYQELLATKKNLRVSQIAFVLNILN